MVPLNFAGQKLGYLVVGYPEATIYTDLLRRICRHIAIGLHNLRERELISVSGRWVDSSLLNEGGGLKMAPGADPCDGKLQVVLAHEIPPLRVLTMLPGLLRGTHIKHPKVECFTCRKIEVIADNRQYLHTDGDVQAFTRHIRVQCYETPMRMPAFSVAENDK